MRRTLSLMAAFAVAATVNAQYLSQPREIWPAKVPGCAEAKAPAQVNPDNGHFTRVTNPTLETFLPAPEKDLHQAVVVCPGGSYEILAYGHEGQEIAQWLAGQGYTAHVLAYRVPKQREGALQDIFRAVRTARSWGAKKVGVIGFSAGGSLCCRAATRWQQPAYEPQDTVDTFSQRPDFAMLIYPAYLDGGEDHTLTPELTVSRETSPLFVFGTEDDTEYSGPSCVTILGAMQKNGAPIELHFLVNGGHGYGMHGDGAGSVWPRLAEVWLRGQR